MAAELIPRWSLGSTTGKMIEIMSRHRPGVPGACHRATQSFVRTNTRYVPASGMVTVVVAPATGVPSPWAMR